MFIISMIISTFVIENVYFCLCKDLKRALKMLLAPMVLILIPVMSYNLGQESIINENAMTCLFYMMLFNVSIYRLMLANMTKTEFQPVSLEHALGLLPMIVHMTSPGKYQAMILEPCAMKMGIVLAFMLFYAHFYLLSNQYLQRNPEKNFWIIKDNNSKLKK